MQQDCKRIRTTLANGLRVLLREVPSAPIVSLWVWYRVGSRNESAGRTGISHWVEHMQFKGTAKHGAGQMDRAISSLSAAFELAEEHGKGVFVLAATSNPEAKLLQQSRLADGRTVAQSVVDEANYYNQTHRNPANNAAFGSVGVVLGATLVLNDFDISTGLKAETVLLILAPGFGAQGAKLSEAKTLFGELRHGLIPNESRSVLSGGARGLVERIEDRAMAVEAALTA